MYCCWIGLSQDRSKWLALVGAVMNFQVHKMWGVPWPTEGIRTSEKWPWCMELFIYLCSYLFIYRVTFQTTQSTLSVRYVLRDSAPITASQLDAMLMSVGLKARWHMKRNNRRHRITQTVLSTEQRHILEERNLRDYYFVMCDVWSNISTQSYDLQRPELLRHAPEVEQSFWSLLYAFDLRTTEFWHATKRHGGEWLAGWLACDSADRSSVIQRCGCDVLLLELRASLLRVNSLKSLSSLEDDGRRFLRNVVIRLPPAAAVCSRRAKSKTCRWQEIFVSRFTVALKLIPRRVFLLTWNVLWLASQGRVP